MTTLLRRGYSCFVARGKTILPPHFKKFLTRKKKKKKSFCNKTETEVFDEKCTENQSC